MDGIRLEGPCEVDEMTVYYGHAWDLSASVLQEVLDAVKAGEMSVAIAGVFNGLEQVPDAHRAMESHAVPGKNVVVPGKNVVVLG